jgi:ribosomal protein L28
MVTSRVLLRGHYNPTGKTRKRPNLQWAKLDGKRVRICTDCIKTISKKPRAARTASVATA